MASSSAGSNGKASRFSTLKVFKLSKKDKESSLPPPPPPKDPYYLNNRSFASLVPDSHSMPSTPLSPPFQYQFPRKQNTFPHPSSSSMSLVSSAASALSYSPDTSHGLTAKKSGFFKFKRSPRSPSVKSSKMDDNTSTQSSSQSCESTDDGISLPWNFQHHLHVDDNLTNLPPSWTTQLADAGLSEDEIAMIQQARRAGARSPASQYLFTDRPSSPTASTEISASSVLTRPTPRTTSLPRQFSDMSLQNHTRPPLPAITSSPSNASLQSSSHTTPSKPRIRNNSGSSLNSDHVPAANLASPAGAVAGAPSTPPVRRFHVTNGMASPPPSYDNSVSPTMQGYQPDRKDRRLFESPSSSPPEAKAPQRAPSNASSIASSKRGSKRRSKRFTALPPRLSLHAHDMSDLSLWSEALISSIPSDLSSPSSGSGSGSGGAGASTRATAGTIVSPSYSFLSASSPSSSDKDAAGPSTSTRVAPSIPPVIVNEDYDDDATSKAPSSAPLSATSWAWGKRLSTSSHNYSAPALNESQSPILPMIPGTGKPGESDRLSSGWLDDEEDTDRHSYLSAGSSDGWRDSSRSSTSTMSTVTVTATTIVRNVSVARRAVANVVDKRNPGSLSNNRSSLPGMGEEDASGGLLPSPTTAEFMGRSRPESLRHPASPLSSIFDSEEGSGSTLSSNSQETPTDPDRASTLLYCAEESSPDPTRARFETDFGGVAKEVVHHEEEFDEVESDGGSYEMEEEAQHVNVHSRTSMSISRPTIVISGSKPLASPGPLTSLTSATPVTPAQRYRGWLSEVVRPLEEFIDEPIDPREYYFDLQEIAEGESGSVYAATLGRDNLQKLRLPPLVKAQDSENAAKGVTSLVAIKCVTILPSGSEKLLDLERELKLLKGLMHTNILGLDALYVDLQDDSLWIRMELMERSLADVIGLTAEGLMLQERMMARFASDILEALQYLYSHDIAHRDVRSDNLLLNSQGFLKLTDFSNAVQVTPECSTSTDQVGVLYWQAPEVRCGPYDPLKIDVWSLGATVWEMAETEPPFSSASVVEDRWPPLSQPELYSPAFRDFLRACSEPAACRPAASDLAKKSFINNACGRVVIVQVLSQCTSIEKNLQEREEYLPQS